LADVVIQAHRLIGRNGHQVAVIHQEFHRGVADGAQGFALFQDIAGLDDALDSRRIDGIDRAVTSDRRDGGDCGHGELRFTLFKWVKTPGPSRDSSLSTELSPGTV
jgi:hypothetical protein